MLLDFGGDNNMNKKMKIKEFASNIGRNAKDLVDGALKSADQNDDGKFNLEDISVIADSVGNSVRKNTQTLKNTVDEKNRDLELRKLQPIFPDVLNSVDFLMPKLIRITERDKKYVDSEVCQGSIGYTSNQKGLRIINLFRDSLKYFGLMFYPDCDDEFYYVDPSNRDKYISLNDYFDYLKVVRISELEIIAQDLGAKYFKVTFKEEKISLAEKNLKAHADAKETIKMDASHVASEKEYSTIEIASENSFVGHAPVEPQLKYMHLDPSIQNLVKLRLDTKSPLLNKKYMLKMSTSSGMKEADAVKIDAVLKEMKCSGNTSVSSEVKNEARRYLEYEIIF